MVLIRYSVNTQYQSNQYQQKQQWELNESVWDIGSGDKQLRLESDLEKKYIFGTEYFKYKETCLFFVVVRIDLITFILYYIYSMWFLCERVQPWSASVDFEGNYKRRVSVRNQKRKWNGVVCKRTPCTSVKMKHSLSCSTVY